MRYEQRIPMYLKNLSPLRVTLQSQGWDCLHQTLRSS